MVIKANNIPWLLIISSILNDIQIWYAAMWLHTVNVCINLINSPLFKKYIIYTLYIFYSTCNGIFLAVQNFSHKIEIWWLKIPLILKVMRFGWKLWRQTRCHAVQNQKKKKKNTGTWNIWWKNGLNKKIYEKLTDESGRKKNQYEYITATRNCSSQN